MPWQPKWLDIPTWEKILSNIKRLWQTFSSTWNCLCFVLSSLGQPLVSWNFTSCAVRAVVPWALSSWPHWSASCNNTSPNQHKLNLHKDNLWRCTEGLCDRSWPWIETTPFLLNFKDLENMKWWYFAWSLDFCRSAPTRSFQSAQASRTNKSDRTWPSQDNPTMAAICSCFVRSKGAHLCQKLKNEPTQLRLSWNLRRPEIFG